MSKLNLVGAVAAGVLAIATFATAGPAAADAGFGVYVSPSYTAPPLRGPRECWHWSYRLQDYVWSCRTHAYRSYPAYPGYAYNYGPSFGFSFGFGDDHHHHHHDRNY